MSNTYVRDSLIEKGLSYREAEVAAAIVTGRTNKEVASKLFVTEKTVKFHLTNIYRKLWVKSRAQLIVFCVSNFGTGSVESTPASTPTAAPAPVAAATPGLPAGAA